MPLIAVRQSYKGEPVAAKYYPAGLSFPVTAFLRPLSKIDPNTGQVVAHNQCVLELYDPLTNDETLVAGQRVPLESDLDHAAGLLPLQAGHEPGQLATDGLLHPDDLLKRLRPGGSDRPMGLYMVQPYEPGKIPVLMVHGLWSSPMTWMEMFNDLRSQPEIRDRYQFWFYLYPTAQPFWLSAAQLRRDLAQGPRRARPDARGAGAGPDGADRPQHGRAGVAAANGPQRRRLLAPGQQRAVRRRSRPTPRCGRSLQETFFFQPNPSIRRVVTIGTPHHGSTFSNQTTQWLLEKLIRLAEDARRQPAGAVPRQPGSVSRPARC